MAEMHEWDEPGFWNKKPKVGITHVSVAIKDIESAILSLRWSNPYGENNDIISTLKTYLPED